MTLFSQHPPADHVLVHISDTHLLAGGRKLYGSIDTDSYLTAFLDRLVASGLDVDALVFTGDLADRGEVDAYQALADRVAPYATSLGAEVIWVMGNHDEIEPFAKVFYNEVATTEPQDRVYDLRGLRVIALDTSVPGYHHGEITQSQREWLAEQLVTPAPHGTLLALHHPPIATPLDLMGVIELEDQASLAEVIRGTDVRGVLAGHLHYSSYSTFAGVPVSVAAAACYNIDLVAEKSTMFSAKENGLSSSLVHVYPETIVFSAVPLTDLPELSSRDSADREAVAAMSPEERKERLSKKTSEFNRAIDEEQSGF